MRKSYNRRPEDFKRRIIKSDIKSRKKLYEEEQRYLDMIKPEEIKNRYYNLNVKNNEVWHKYEEHIKTVGQRVSIAKKGKSTGPCSSETAEKISKANKGRKFSAEHKEKLRLAKLGKKHTEEWKQQNSERLKNQWSDGTRKRAEPKIKMSRQEQDALCSVQLKSRWSNADWKEKQRLKLKEAWLRRKLNSIESQSAEI
jgi:hypothetical protein